MAGFAGERDDEAALTDDGLNHTQRIVQAFQYGTLLDVNLKIAESVICQPGFNETRWVEAERTNCIGNAQAVRIENVEKRFIQCAHQRAASDERDTEAHTFLFREANNLNAERHAEAGQGVHHGNAHDDSENAIESSGVRNGIEMRTDDYAACSGSSCWIEAAEISGGVNRDAHAELFHAAGKLTMNVAHGRRQKCARGVAGLFSEFGQFAAQ